MQVSKLIVTYKRGQECRVYNGNTSEHKNNGSYMMPILNKLQG